MTDRTTRVLVVGRSARALTETVSMLRARGIAANATNQFDRVLEDYDARDLDLVLFGGQVPPPLREHLEAEMLRRHPDVQLRSGLGGMAPLRCSPPRWRSSSAARRPASSTTPRPASCA
ncbi:hypothetical protein [Isoptericola sp. NPDC056134]|uniref:hypothetical protein n=1 Tax=Isoptericola sp. NPDC056134 TaxID=3345723 RepID=UPI0035E866FB